MLWGCSIEKLKLSELYTSLPPPDSLEPLMVTLPNTLLVCQHKQWAVLLETESNLARLVAGKVYSIPYYGYRLDVGILPIDRILNHRMLIVKSLPNRATLALIQ